MSNLLKRVADYFANVYTGDDKTAPKLDLNVCELREIANMHVDKCKTEAELREAKETIRKLLCSEYGSSCSFCIQDKILMQCVVMLVAVVVGAAKMRNGMAKAKNRQLNQPK